MSNETPPPIPPKTDLTEPESIDFNEVQDSVSEGSDTAEAEEDATEEKRSKIKGLFLGILKLGQYKRKQKRNSAATTNVPADDKNDITAPEEKFKMADNGPANQLAGVLREKFPNIICKPSGAENGIQQTEVVAGGSSAIVIFSTSDNEFSITGANKGAVTKLRKIVEKNIPNYRYVFPSQIQSDGEQPDGAVALKDTDEFDDLGGSSAEEPVEILPIEEAGKALAKNMKVDLEKRGKGIELGEVSDANGTKRVKIIVTGSSGDPRSVIELFEKGGAHKYRYVASSGYELIGHILKESPTLNGYTLLEPKKKKEGVSK